MGSLIKNVALAASTWGAGRIDLFTLDVTTSALLHKSYGSSSSWSDWQSVGGSWQSCPSAYSQRPNSIDVFGTGTDKGAWHRSYSGSSWSPSWESHGGTFGSGLCMASTGSGNLDYFGTGTDSQAWGQESSSGSWSPFETEGGTFAAGFGLSVTATSSASVEIVGLGQDGSCWHKRKYNGQWGSWDNVGGSNWATEFFSLSISVSILDVFGVKSDGSMWHNRYDGSKWSSWENMGGSCASKPHAISWGSNRMDCFCTGHDGGMYHKSWSQSTGWSTSGASNGWEAMGGNFDSAPAAVTWGPNNMNCFGKGSDGGYHQRSYSSSGWADSWTTV